MHPYLMYTIAATRQQELLEEARVRGLARAARRPAPGPDVTVRFARDTDALALDRLPGLAERPPPPGKNGAATPPYPFALLALDGS